MKLKLQKIKLDLSYLKLFKITLLLTSVKIVEDYLYQHPLAIILIKKEEIIKNIVIIYIKILEKLAEKLVL